MHRYTIWFLPVFLILAGLTPTGWADLELVARDDASNYTNWWGSNLDQRVGFDPWLFKTSGGGTYLASTFDNQPNPRGDLNYTWSVPGFHAWATWADGGGEQNVAVYRGFDYAGGAVWKNRLENAGDTFKLSMEYGESVFNGRCGFALRNQNFDATADYYTTNAVFEFAFVSGLLTYEISDGSPGSPYDTGLSGTEDGIDVVLKLTGTNTYDFSVYSATNSELQLFQTNGILDAQLPIDSVALFNRNTDNPDRNVFFNKLEIWKFHLPTVLMVK